jgi:hypothetical protein
MMDCGRSKSARGQGEAVSGKSQGCSCLRVFGTDKCDMIGTDNAEVGGV